MKTAQALGHHGSAEAPRRRGLSRLLHAGGSRVALRYALLPALALGLLTIALLLVGERVAEREVAERTSHRVRQQADTLAALLTDRLRGLRREVALLARSPRVRPGLPAHQVRAELEHLLQADDAFVWIGLVSLDGQVLAGTHGWLEGRSIATRPVYLGGRDASFVGDVHPAVALGQLLSEAGQAPQELIDIGEPVRDEHGRVVAVLAAHPGVAWINRLRDSSAAAGPVGADDDIQTHVITGDPLRSVVPGAVLPEGLTLPPRGGAAEHLGGDGRAWFVAQAEMPAVGLAPPPLPWRIVALANRSAAMAPVARTQRALIVYGAATALLLAAAGWWVARRLMNPWTPMFEAVLRRTGGHDDPRSLAEAVQVVLREGAAPDSRPAGDPERLVARLAEGARSAQRVFDHLPVGVALIDRSFRVEHLNPEYSRLLGWTTEQVRGRVAGEFLFDPIERLEWLRLFDLLGDTPGPVSARFDAFRPDGQRVAVQWDLVPLLGRDGTVEGAIALITDIRPERAARARAQALAGRLRALADAALDDALATLDFDGRVVEWSRGAERLTGHSSPQALGQMLDELLPCEEDLASRLLKARRDGRFPVAGLHRRADGAMRWIEGSIYPLGLAPGAARYGVILRDLTAQREVHERLERSEERLRLAMEAAHMGTWEVDLQAEPPIATWTETFADINGLPPEGTAQPAEALASLLHPEDRPQMRSAFLAAVRDGQPLATEFRLQRAGQWRWLHIRGRALRGADGRATRILAVGADITERKRAETELQAARARLEDIVQTMAEGLVVLDAAGHYTLVNRAALKMLNLEASNVLGRRYDDVPWQRVDSGGAPLPPGRHAWSRLRRGEAAVRDEIVGIEGPGGRRVLTAVSAVPLRDEQGHFDGALLTFVDVTERQQALQALADNEARLVAIVAGASDAIVSTDVDGRISLFNPAAERIFGVGADAVTGAPLDRLLPGEARPTHGAHMREFVRSGVTRRAMSAGRVRGQRADGSSLELEASISQALVHGEVVLTAILRDVTERVAQERVLERTRAELAQLNRQLLEQEKQTTRRLAQALHDELGQTLTALRLHWDALQSGAPTRASELRERMTLLIATAHRQIRGVLGELRPPLLDEFGLTAALDNEMQQQRPVDDVPALKLEVPARLQHQRWPADVEYAAFMVGREALVNALHHAQARQIEISIEGDEGELVLTVRDDGVGLVSAALPQPGHLGLVGMRERAYAIGANLSLGRGPERGTTMTLHWTMSDEQDLPGR